MVKTLNVLGGILLVIGFAGGIFNGIYVNWWYAIIFMTSSIVSALLFFAFAYMIELLEENNSYLRYLFNQAREEAPSSRGNSRSSLDKMQGYSFKGID